MSHEGDKNPVITIPGLGVVQGILDPTHKVAKFLNVPFGIVQERWRPAVKAQPWNGVLDASCNGPMSPQQTVNHPFITMLLGAPSTNDFENTMSERDCLNCNIFMPTSAALTSSELLPVMVWIYGGSFRAGTNSSPLYDCTEMLLTGIDLQKPFIAVAINYRVNYLGFLSSSELLLDNQHHIQTIIPPQQQKWYDGSIGNWGLLDQILGLEWIQEYIGAFGGDKGKEGLEPLEKVRRLRGVCAKDLAEELNLVELVCFRPALDGVVFREDSRVLVGDPEAYGRELEWVVTGTCNDEGSVFAPMFGATTLEAFASLKTRLCPPSDSAFFDTLFGIPSTDAEAAIISARLTGNGIFKYPTLQVSQAILAHPTAQLTRFHFDTHIKGEEKIMQGLGAHHGIDMFFTFGGKVAEDLLEMNERRMIRKVQEVWIEVITAHSPESSYLPKVSSSFSFLPTNNEADTLPKEAIVFGNDMQIHKDIAERMSIDEIEFWKRASAFAVEKTTKGRGHQVFFDFSQGILTSAP
ncbi:hypothetical protein KI688_008061 [Linnemannia hyalina]|uniref:Carboxylesterase type B domain-containing protein n=1 Tax=Linnemannia hyalina TaxID=64524 RepID=A0A9P8BWQ0_9FUNG|nr:hypothetical protein KI688_008061 [Linnemannia hyalina]